MPRPEKLPPSKRVDSNKLIIEEMLKILDEQHYEIVDLKKEIKKK